MKIEITNENDNGYFIYENGNNRPLKNYRNNFINPFTFDDQDIFWLIGEKNFDNDFQKGKYQFNVSKKHLQLITGERSAANKMELAMYQS